MSLTPLSPFGFSDIENSPLQDAQEPDDVFDFDDGETLASSPVDAGEIRQRTETPQPGAFRFKGRYCVLTYSQVPPTFNPGDISELLRRDRASFIVCREPHRDGGTHYHVFVDYKRVRDLNGARRWDVQGVHPNLLRVRRTPWRAYAYVTKHQDVVRDTFTDRDRPTPPTRGANADGVGKRRWEAITNAPDKDSFFAKCAEMDPRALVTAFGNVSRYADWKYPDLRGSYDSPGGIAFDLGGYPELKEYFRTWLNQSGR